MARGRRNKDGFLFLFFAAIVLVIFIIGKIIETFFEHPFVSSGVVILIITLYILHKKDQKIKRETRRQELLEYNSETQNKVIQEMVCHLNEILNFEKHSVTKFEKSKKKQLKEKYQNAREQFTTSFVYIIQEGSNGYIKIGKANDPLNRIVHGLGAKSPYTLKVLHLIPSSVPLEVEKWLHRNYEHYRINGEWFNLNPEQKDELRPNNYPLELLEIITK